MPSYSLKGSFLASARECVIAFGVGKPGQNFNGEGARAARVETDQGEVQRPASRQKRGQPVRGALRWLMLGS